MTPISLALTGTAKYYNYYQDAYGNIRAYEEAGETATGYGLILDYDVYKTGAFEGRPDLETPGRP